MYMSKEGNYFYEFGPFRLDPGRRLLLRDVEPLPLRPKAFDTLLVLVQNSGRVLNKDELMQAVWGDTIVEEGGLVRNISVLRKALGESPDEHRYIVTAPGRGYCFVATVRKVVSEDHNDANGPLPEPPPPAPVSPALPIIDESYSNGHEVAPAAQGSRNGTRAEAKSLAATDV